MKPMPWWGYLLGPVLLVGFVVGSFLVLIIVLPVGLMAEMTCEVMGWTKPRWVKEFQFGQGFKK